MTTRWSQALQAVVRTTAIPVEAIERLDDGGDRRVHVTAVPEGKARWFVVDDAGCRPLSPFEDPRLPLGARLTEELAAGARVEVLSYRPGRRLTVRRTTEQRPSAVLKGYRRRRMRGALARHAFAEASLAPAPVAVPRLNGHDASGHYLELEDVPGRPVELDADTAPLFGRVGVALATLQRQAAAEPLVPHTHEDELAVVDRLAQRMQALVGALPEGWLELRAALGAQDVTALQAAPLVPSHRDLHDGQLLCHGEQLWLLDFDLLCLADPCLDAANLEVHLQLRHLQGRVGGGQPTVEACTRALWQGLGEPRGPGGNERLRFYRVASLLRLALVYGLRPRWARLPPRLVALARAGLGEARHA